MPKGNPNGQVARFHVAPTLRGAFLKALDIRGKRIGKTLPEIMDELIEEEGLLTVMDRIAKFQERTSSVEMNHSGEVGLVGILEALGGARHDSQVEKEPGSVRH